MKMASITADHFDIPLPFVMTGSTHGKIRHFLGITGAKAYNPA